MLGIFIYYLFVGAVFSMVVDISTWWYRRKGMEVPASAEWDWSTRTIAILIWPLGVIYFLAGVIIAIINNNKNN